MLLLHFFNSDARPKRIQCPSLIEEKTCYQSDSAMKPICGITQKQRYLVTYTFDIKIINVKAIVIIEKNIIGIWFANFGSLFSLTIIALILPPDTTLQ
jgi:hypothetical protein